MTCLNKTIYKAFNVTSISHINFMLFVVTVWQEASALRGATNNIKALKVENNSASQLLHMAIQLSEWSTALHFQFRLPTITAPPKPYCNSN